MTHWLMLLVFFNSQALGADARDCLLAGGEFKGRGCYCSSIGLYVDPKAEMCLPLTVAKAVDLIHKINSQKGVPEISSERPVAVDNLSSVSKIEFCANPALWLCQESINPWISRFRKSEDVFHQITKRAEAQVAVQKLLLREGKKELSRCSQLKVDAWQKCQTLIKSSIEKSVYQPERKQKAQKLFNSAKGLLLQLIEKRRKELNPSAPLEEKIVIDRMSQTIKNAQIHFGTYLENDPLSFSVSMKGMIPFKDQIKNKDDIEKNYQDTLYLEGLLLTVDENPEALKTIFIYELAHLIGPGRNSFRSDDRYQHHPFQNALQCLQSESSIDAKKGDANCFRTQSQKYATTDPKKSQALSLTASDIDRNADVAWVNPSLPKSESCQMGQLAEAFADWLTAEAFALANKDFLSRLEEPLPKEPLDRVHLAARVDQLPQILAALSPRCLNQIQEESADFLQAQSKGSHPLAKAQMNALWFANPQLRAAIGCGESIAPPLYCGGASEGTHK